MDDPEKRLTVSDRLMLAAHDLFYPAVKRSFALAVTDTQLSFGTISFSTFQPCFESFKLSFTPLKFKFALKILLKKQGL